MKLKYCFNGIDIELDINEFDLKYALINIMCQDAGVKQTSEVEKLAEYFIDELFPAEDLAESFYEQLWDYFLDDAHDKAREIEKLDPFERGRL